MEQIVVKSQAELDAINIDYNGRIIVEFGTPYKRAVVNRKFRFSVEARGNSSVVAWDNSSVAAMGNSSVVARGNSSVVAWDNSSVVAMGNSSVVARGNSSVVAWDNSSVVARGNSSVEARGNSSVEAFGNSSVVAWDNSSVVAMGNSSVVAWDNSSVEARGNSQVVDSTDTHDIKTNGNARIVYEPKTIDEYLDYYGIERNGNYARLYKAVHKRGDYYVSNWDSDFAYLVGTVAESANGFNTDVFEDCGAGLHIAYKEWCVDYGRDWDDLAILEVEAEIESIIVPLLNTGKVRAQKVKVIREVPLEECGLLGKIIAKRRAKK